MIKTFIRPKKIFINTSSELKHGGMTMIATGTINNAIYYEYHGHGS